MNKKIAIPVDDSGMLDGHFGHCKFFAVLTATDKIIEEEKMIVPPPHEPGLLPKWLAEQGVTDVLAGGMGQKAIQIFNYNEVNVWVGAPRKSARDIAQGFLDNSIQFTANNCDH